MTVIPLLIAAVVLGPESNGRTIRGETFSAKAELAPFTEGTDGVWTVKTPPGAKFDQLWINGEWAQRATAVNDGFLYYREGLLPDCEVFRINEPERYPCLKAITPDEIPGLLIRNYCSWDTETFKPKELDVATGRLRIHGKTYYNVFHWGRYMPRFTLENSKAFLDAPGEWYHDEKAGVLYYIPKAGEQVATTRAAYATGSRLLKGDGVSDLVFEDCVFEYSGHLFADAFHSHQAGRDIPAAVEFNFATNLVFRNCRFRNLSECALWINESCREVTIENCDFTDLGAGAVRVGPKYWREPKHNETVNAVMRGCRAVRGGLLFPEAVGIVFTHVVNSAIVGNEVADWRYSGISLGWVWGYKPCVNHDNLIASNHVWNICQGILCDGGCIYHLGTSPGTVIRDNFCHDCWGYDYGAAGGYGIYLDEGSSYLKVVSNRVARTRDNTYTLHYGKENLFQGNVGTRPAVSGTTFPEKGGRPEKHVQTILVDNVEVAVDDPRLADLPPPPEWKLPRKPPLQPPHFAFADDFEARSPGEAVSGVLNTRGWISVTDEVAKSGRHSLKFKDGNPKLADYMPHLFSRFDPTENGRFSFSLAFRTGDERTELGALLRDYRVATPTGTGFFDGPGIAVRAGKLFVTGDAQGEVELCRVKAGEWHEMKLVIAPAREKPVEYELEVRSAEGETFTRKGTAKPGFQRADWVGIISPATCDTFYYIDDFGYNPEK